MLWGSGGSSSYICYVWSSEGLLPEQCKIFSKRSKWQWQAAISRVPVTYWTYWLSVAFGGSCQKGNIFFKYYLLIYIKAFLIKLFKFVKKNICFGSTGCSKVWFWRNISRKWIPKLCLCSRLVCASWAKNMQTSVHITRCSALPQELLYQVSLFPKLTK